MKRNQKLVATRALLIAAARNVEAATRMLPKVKDKSGVKLPINLHVTQCVLSNTIEACDELIIAAGAWKDVQ